MHPSLKKEFDEHIAAEKTISKKAQKHKMPSESTNVKQRKITGSLNNANKHIPNQKFADLIVNVVVSAQLPISFVDNDSVKALLQAGFPSNEHFGRNKLMDLIHQRYHTMKSNQIKVFEAADYVCLTADCWSSYRR